MEGGGGVRKGGREREGEGGRVEKKESHRLYQSGFLVASSKGLSFK